MHVQLVNFDEFGPKSCHEWQTSLASGVVAFIRFTITEHGQPRSNHPNGLSVLHAQCVTMVLMFLGVTSADPASLTCSWRCYRNAWHQHIVVMLVYLVHNNCVSAQHILGVAHAAQARMAHAHGNDVCPLTHNI